jgi:hypothetical protein
LKGNKADHFLAELLESKSDATKTLVAEVDGNVVGFISLTQEIDQEVITKTYDLSIFDNCIKGNVSYPKSYFYSSRAIEVPPEILEVASSTIMAEPELPAQPLTNEDGEIIPIDAYAVEMAAANKLAAAKAAREAAIHAAKELREQPNIFCVSLLCIEDEYANHSVEFLKAAFSVFPSRDYCVITVSTALPEIPLLRYFKYIHPKPGKVVS